jgi:uncharacterized protein (DUF3820 family)
MAFMNFGKHKGQHVSDVPTLYLQWCLREATCLKDWLRHAIQDELARRCDQPQARPSGALVDLPATIRTWYRELVMKYHPDRGGSHEAMVAITDAKERLEQMVGV